MITEFGVKNLRSFYQEISVPLKPLTVFVGRNSSGKSSLLRAFPLLRQSIEANTTGPILWYGRLVDFGDYSQAISRNAKENEISFIFCTDIFTHPVIKRTDLFIRAQGDLKRHIKNAKVKLNVSSNKEKTITKNIEITIEDTCIKIDLQKQQPTLSIHNKHVNFTFDNMVFEENDGFIPEILGLKDTSEKKEDIIKPDVFTNINPRAQRRKTIQSYYDIISSKTATALDIFFHYNTYPHTIRNYLDSAFYFNKSTIDIFIERRFADQKYFSNQMLNPDKKKKANEIIHAYALLRYFNEIADRINYEIRKSMVSVKYLAPIRASAERYYRFQDLQVDEMDHTGSNLAMILNSLSDDEKSSFSNWTKENFGFSVFVEQSASHYAIKIINENDDIVYNINDMGFGYSQVLPIIMSVWLELNSTSKTDEKECTFVIEQPELHLHPAYQSKLAKLFSKIIALSKDKNSKIRFIFETHSQSMIDAIGECIEDKNIEINENDVSIVVFDKINGNGTDVTFSKYDANGYLTNWPIGFFEGN